MSSRLKWWLGGGCLALAWLASGATVLATAQEASEPATAPPVRWLNEEPGDQPRATREDHDRLSLVDDSGRPRNEPLPSIPGRHLDELVERIMLQNVDQFRYGELPFSEVMKDMENHYGLNAVLDHSAIDDALDDDTLVSIDLRGISLEECLNHLLVKYNATFIVRDGVVLFVSRDVANDPEYFERRIFDISALAAELPKRVRDRLPGQPTPVPEAAPGVEPGEVKPQTPDLTTLEQLVTEVVDQGGWTQTGNGDAVLYEINGRLIVHASGRSMREIRDFLAHLAAEFGVGPESGN